MRAIRIDNPVLNSYLTDIAADYSSGTSLVVRSNNSFADSDLLVVGNPKEELTELKKVQSVSGNTILTLASALKFSHNKTTPIYKSLWDFVEIEGRSSSAGSFATLTQSPIQWDNKNGKTIFFHPTGSDNWEYRFKFYNSATLSYSEYSPTLGGGGFTKFQMGYIIREARRIAGDKDGAAMSIDELLRAATRAKNIIRAHNPRFWFWKVDGYQSGASIPAIAGTSVYSLSSITRLGVVNYIEYQYNNGATNEKYVLRRKPDPEFLEWTRDLNRPSLDYAYFYRLLPPDSNSTKGYFEVENKIKNSGVGTFYISHYKEEDDYTTVEDDTAIIMPEILQDYLIAEIYMTKGNEAQAERYYNRFAGPEQREKTLALKDLTGIALLDALDDQYKETQSEPKTLWRYRGQKAITRLFGSRQRSNSDDIRENYFDGYE